MMLNLHGLELIPQQNLLKQTICPGAEATPNFCLFLVLQLAVCQTLNTDRSEARTLPNFLFGLLRPSCPIAQFCMSCINLLLLRRAEDTVLPSRKVDGRASPDTAEPAGLLQGIFSEPC